MRNDPIRRIALILLFAAAACGLRLEAARAELPAHLVVDIERVARNYEAAIAQRATAANVHADVEGQFETRVAVANMSALVVAAIARRPAQVGEIIAYAAQAAPALRDGVVRDAQTAFPAFAPIIQDAAARPAVYLARGGAEPGSEAASPGGGPRAPPSEDLPELEVEMPPGADALDAITPAADGALDAAADADLSLYDELDDDALVALYDAPDTEIDDPLEDINRAIFWFNMDVMDRYLIRPIAWVYGKVMPEYAKQPVRNAFRNLNAPVVLANDLLQGELTDAGVTLARFALNSTLGLAGLFDPAASLGLEHHPADFGQTLHVWGLGSGPYLVLPFFGPSNLRDTAGLVVDTVLDPLPYVVDDRTITLGLTIGNGITRREAVLIELDALRDSSVDFYAALRSAYFQNRQAALVRDP